MSNLKLNSNYFWLREAIQKEYKVQAESILQNIPSVNIPNTKDNTLLHWAIINFEDVDILTMLLDKGANIHAENYHNHKPLYVAIQNNKTEAAQLLIRRGALVGEDLNELLLMAIERKNDIIVKTLMDHGIKLNPSIDLKTPLNLAIAQRQPIIIEYIGPYFQLFKPSDQYIPREAVVKSGFQCKECVELLLKWNFIVSPDSNHDEDFVYGAVKNGYLPIVVQLLKYGIDVNMRNPDTGLNLLQVACLLKHYEIVERLLKYNACPNVKTPINTKILNNLSRYNHNNQLQFIHDTNKLREITCLHIAVLNSDVKMTKLLLEYGAIIINDPTFFNITCIAVQINCEEIVRLFLDHGVNVNEINSEGKSLLCFCVDYISDGRDSRYNIAKLILEKGANVNIQISGNSLLFEAIKNRHRKIALSFLEYNADIKYINKNGDTLLHRAVKSKLHIEFIKTLLNLNLPVNAVNNDMHTPLHVACKPYSEHQLNVIEALLDYNADVNCTDKDMKTPLHFACYDESLEVVEILLKKGANPNIKDNKGQTPLHLICEQSYIPLASSMPMTGYYDKTLSIIRLLLDHNANIDAVDNRGWTPLFVACENYHYAAVKCLLDNHANANHTDLENSTPLYIALLNSNHHCKVLKLLLKHKVNVHFTDKWGNSMIHVVVEIDRPELIESFFHTQVDFNSINKKGNTPLHIAVKKRSIDMVENLIKYGADVNILDKNNRTAVHYAMKYIENFRNSYLDIDMWFHYIDYDFDMAKMLAMHIVRLKVAGLKVNNQNLKIVYHFDENETSDDESTDEEDAYQFNIPQMEVKCEREIKKMRAKRIGVHNMTFYDLLTKNIHFLSRCIKNKKIRQTLQQKVYDKKYPLYMDIVRRRFRDAKFRHKMLNSAKNCFSLNVTQRLPHDYIDTVFSYLNINELKMFIRAMKPLDG